MALKMLCLHGYRQNAESFKKKFGAFRKIAKNVTELVFIDAPNVSSDDKPVEGQCLGPGLGWWLLSKDGTSPLMTTDVCPSFEESVQLINTVFETQGPFDGVLGFSQGAAMAALLCALQESKEFKHTFGFAILFAGFISKSSYLESLFKLPITIPSLHVIGETDQVIPKAYSEELSRCFNAPKILYHPGGHFVPTSSTYKTEYLAFLTEMHKKM